ncbi:MAG: Ig-like domain-containing protein [Fibrobacterota bacterium]
MKLLLLLPLLLCFTSCAHKSFPDGGPGDMTNPEITNISPPDGTTNTNPGESITITLSEWISPATAREAIRVSPAVKGGYDMSVRRNTITISPRDKWEDETTYHVHINSGLTDYAHNSLTRPRSVIFSTGETLNEGHIRGIVYPLPDIDTSRISIHLISQEDHENYDSLLTLSPDYITEPNEDNMFSFNHIRTGSYICFGILNPKPHGGLTPNDTVFIADSLLLSTRDTTLFHLSPARFDPTPLAIDSAESLPGGFIKAALTRPAIFEDSIYALRMYSPRDTFELESYHWNSDSSAIFTASPAQPDSDCVIELTTKNHYHPHREDTQTISASPIATGPEESDAIRENRILSFSADTDTIPISCTVMWKEYVHNTPDQKLVFQDQNGDSHIFLNKSTGISKRSRFVAEGETVFSTELTGEIGPQSIAPLYSTQNTDTLITFTAPLQGSFGRNFVFYDSAHVLENAAVELSGTRQENQYTVSLDSARTVLPFPRADIYRLNIFIDKTNTGSFTLGRMVPFRQGDRYLNFSDTLEITPRWETEYLYVPPQ